MTKAGKGGGHHAFLPLKEWKRGGPVALSAICCWGSLAPAPGETESFPRLCWRGKVRANVWLGGSHRISGAEPAGSWDAQGGRPQLWPGIPPEQVEENMHMAHWQWGCWGLAEGRSRPGKGRWLEGQREHNCIKEQTSEWQNTEEICFT